MLGRVDASITLPSEESMQASLSPRSIGAFLSRKPHILESLRHAIDHADMDALTRRRQTKRTL